MGHKSKCLNNVMGIDICREVGTIKTFPSPLLIQWCPPCSNSCIYIYKGRALLRVNYEG